MTDTAEIAEWYALAQEAAAELMRVMRPVLAEATDRAEALWVGHRTAPEDMGAEELTAVLLVTAAELVDAQAEVERLRLHSRLLNTITFKIAEALGEVPEGATAVEGDPFALAARLIDRLNSEKIPNGVARVLEAAAIRRYADRYHSFAGSHPGTSGPGEPLDPDAWCKCGAAWSEDDGGCVERAMLLEEAKIITATLAAPVMGT